MYVVYGGQTQERLKKLDHVNGLLRIAVAAERKGENDGPDLTTSDFSEVINLNKSQPLYVEYEVLLAGETGVPIEKNITLGSAVKIELSCRLDDKYSSMKILHVTWKKGNETIKHIRKTENSWSIQRKVNVHPFPKGDWIEGREKPVISYEGDSAILICKSHSYTPIAWTWYMTNGSEQIAINDSVMLDKYVIDKADPNVTHLKILKLTKEDDGEYWCEAAFELGRSKGKLKLSILSLMVPLKPFLAIVAEVVILITVIFVFELYSKKKEKRAEAEKECDQIEQLLSEAKEEYKCSSMSRIRNGEHGSTRDVKQGITGV
ncbi:UNVERIFIED_CONTAM: hypothetical protein H355_011635 [Colinus virginianus]|nr:hypothetical protein H355_011635 [Colinus virginianus]